MGLLLICPHCLAKTALASRSCPACGADLRNLPPKDRCYFSGRPEEVVSPPSALEGWPPAPWTGAVADMSGCQEPLPPEAGGAENQEVSLCEALDRILNKGAVIYGEVMISVADIDLVYLGLQVILSSMETARGFRPVPAEAKGNPNLFEKRT